MYDIKIFLFHRVSPHRDPMWEPMHPALFNRIIHYLSRKFLCIKLEDYFRDPSAFGTPKKQMCAVVFDDGYADFLQYALPILKQHNVPASMYVVTDCVERQLPPWTYQLDFCFANSKKLHFDIETALLPENLKQIKWANAQQRVAYGKALKPFLKTVPDTIRKQIFSSIIMSAEDVKIPADMLMDWSDIRACISEGVEIGSHTHTHPLLAKLETDELIKSELTLSKELIKKHCGIEPYTISYPIGSYSENVMEISANVGYGMGLAVDQRFYKPKRDLHFSIPRVELYNEAWWKVMLRLTGVYSKIQSLRS